MRPLIIVSAVVATFTATLAFVSVEKQSNINISDLYTPEVETLVAGDEKFCIGNVDEHLCRYKDKMSGKDTLSGRR